MKIDLKNKLLKIPTDPGVYQFSDTKKQIIYIGKAKNLKNRLRSYINSKSHSPKNVAMLRNAINVDWIVVRNEVEALITEANLIKTHSPKYNILMKDDKTYPFIRITNEPYPQVLLTRKIINDNSKYYGPFTDVKHLRTTMKALHELFPIRSCNYYIDDEVILLKKISVCLDYHIKKCEGPCEGLVNEIKYNEMIIRICKFLEGKTKPTKDHLKKLMEESSKNLLFEEAAKFRDQLKAINSFVDKQSKSKIDFKDRDVLGLAKKDNFGIMVIIRIRNGRIFSREKISLQRLDSNDKDTYKMVLSQFYLESNFVPGYISLNTKPESENDLLKWLSKKKGKNVKFIYPKRGEKEKELRITNKNAELLLSEWLIKRNQRKDLVPKTLKRLQMDLSLSIPPRIIEAFDISHLGGENTVASMVVFKDSKPLKKNYRKFNIKTVKGIDDFASMNEVINRRYKRIKKEGSKIPDLILIDGGKGQLSSALSALNKLGLGYINIIGLAKRLEEVYIPGNPEPQSIHKQSSGLVLLRRIRDEAHRFAINFHRKKRSKAMSASIFNGVNGLGKIRIKKLLTVFENPKKISKIKVTEISKKTGIPIKVCKEIVEVAKAI